MSELHRSPLVASKKFSTPTLMSCRSPAPQNHSLFLMIGPPNSAENTSMRCSGLPERNPFAPALNSSSLTLLFCILSFSKVNTDEPLNTLLPLLVTRLIDSPDDWIETSPPPLTTWICSNESKLKYDGEEFEERSVIEPPSRFHCTLALVPRDDRPTCWPEDEPPTFRPAWTPGVMLMICHGSRADGIFSSTSEVKTAPVDTFLVSTTGEAPETVNSSVIWPISSF